MKVLAYLRSSTATAVSSATIVSRRLGFAACAALCAACLAWVAASAASSAGETRAVLSGAGRRRRASCAARSAPATDESVGQTGAKRSTTIRPSGASYAASVATHGAPSLAPRGTGSAGGGYGVGTGVGGVVCAQSGEASRHSVSGAIERAD